VSRSVLVQSIALYFLIQLFMYRSYNYFAESNCEHSQYCDQGCVGCSTDYSLASNKPIPQTVSLYQHFFLRDLQ
jgi:hypothetical protein